MADGETDLKRTPLHALHVDLGAKLAPFAGYEMPIQYQAGVLKEHVHTREAAGLFDVSHMGQAWLETSEVPIGGPQAHGAIAAAMERLCPSEIEKLRRGGLRYSALLSADGGILDDLMITRPAAAEDAGRLLLVVNAACKDNDFSFIEETLGERIRLRRLEDRALIALQGPSAATVIGRIFPGADQQRFMTMSVAAFDGREVYLSRCGYTGEDGFEISLPVDCADAFARALLEDKAVMPIGLGARDSLRLEAGLCLYGHDLTRAHSPVDGNIAFIIGKRRRTEGGFNGDARILKELEDGTRQLRVGVAPDGRAPAREGTRILGDHGEDIGIVTSGGFGPSTQTPIAMGYVDAAYAKTGSTVQLDIRGRSAPARIVDLPFFPHRYYRGH